ncbi:DNA topoisomerase IB [Melittangium boletus]|uniref:DNA topoisomerase n=1 Tax=Melittangium boletus DSM 14713 TaxID=1294270 RepID=A0A250IQF9_9BACT|nr:DNA topoisomerase IB [Melittangium boletus]ATB33401.1 DNA topoisomerase IB (poxvirus type) [Melittangium boletus DSM 14713]
MTHIERMQREGIRRRGSPQRGFRYLRPDGQRVSAKESQRIAAMKLPPAWKDVFISGSPGAKLQALGKDSAGRWQYRYHPSFTRRQEEAKFQRIVDFARALPKLRRRVAEDLRQRGLGRNRVMACLLRILGTCFIRPGSQQYADENQSFGLATLRARHVKLKGDTVIFDFPGKSGQRQHRELKDRQVARVVRECLRVPGRDIFKFILDDGLVVDVRRRHINEYIREVMGERYSAKDFRTWGGTLICACALARAQGRACDGAGLRAVKKTMVAAVKEAATQLGNTPTVARDSYIYPSVLAMFKQGRVVGRYFETVEELAQQEKPGLHRAEKALLEMLESPGLAAV